MYLQVLLLAASNGDHKEMNRQANTSARGFMNKVLILMRVRTQIDGENNTDLIKENLIHVAFVE